MINKEARRLKNQRMSRDHPNHSITKVNQNTEKSPGDLRRPAITQTPVKNHVQNSQRNKIIIHRNYREHNKTRKYLRINEVYVLIILQIKKK